MAMDSPQLRLWWFGVGLSPLLTMAATTRPAMAMAATTAGMASVAWGTTEAITGLGWGTTAGMASVAWDMVGLASAVATASALVEWAAGVKAILRRCAR